MPKVQAKKKSMLAVSKRTATVKAPLSDYQLRAQKAWKTRRRNQAKSG